jgi:hypothetical protein
MLPLRHFFCIQAVEQPLLNEEAQYPMLDLLLSGCYCRRRERSCQAVPASHFGLILDWDQYQLLVSRLKDLAVEFAIEPTIRFEGRRGEQATLFICDPSGNYLEFKAFRDIEALFDKDLDAY